MAPNQLTTIGNVIETNGFGLTNWSSPDWKAQEPMTHPREFVNFRIRPIVHLPAWLRGLMVQAAK